MNELDRILLNLDSPEPSAGFTSDVMSAIRREASVQTISSPAWLLGLGALVVAMLALLFVSVQGIDLTESTTPDLAAKALWGALLLVATTVAAVLPLQLFDS